MDSEAILQLENGDEIYHSILGECIFKGLDYDTADPNEKPTAFLGVWCQFATDNGQDILQRWYETNCTHESMFDFDNNMLLEDYRSCVNLRKPEIEGYEEWVEKCLSQKLKPLNKKEL